MTAPLWMPGATTRPSTHNGGTMTGTSAYSTWHTYECDYSVSAMSGARSLIAAGNEVHLCFNPVTGDVVQMLPANVAARGLVNQAGGVETNRQGRVNLQMEVIGRASRPWTQDLTAAGRATLARILAWYDSHGVPRTAPNGHVGPVSYAASTSRTRSVTAWNGPGGYFCHADVPENDHWDHGAVDFRTIWAVAPLGPTPATPLEDDMFSDADRTLLNYVSAQVKATAQLVVDKTNYLAAHQVDPAALSAAIIAALPADTTDVAAIEAAVKAGIESISVTVTPTP